MYVLYVCMFLHVCMCVYVYSIELDSTVSEYYAYDPINHLNAYQISLELQRYYLCLKSCTSLSVLVNQSQSIHHLAGTTPSH